MKVKAVDIARELGISTATVSLAMNNREGVSESTRTKVLECKKRLEESGGAMIPTNGRLSGVIKNIIIMRGGEVVKGGELDIAMGARLEMDRIVKSWGCSLEVEYYNVTTDSPEHLAAKCNEASVIGVIVSGAEMISEDQKILDLIRKPIVISDTDISSKYSCAVFNNAEAVKQAVYYLVQRKMKNIVYLAYDVDIYNFRERKEGFRSAMTECNLYSEEKMVRLGFSVEESYVGLKRYLDMNGIPDAFITECYPLSIAVMRAFKSMGIEMPRDVSVIGVDELPEYLTYDCQLSTIRVPHMERLKMLMMLLRHEIEDANPINKSKLVVNCDFIKGSTVAELQ